ncbi:sensor histidine kinase [Pedobacter deserti]|uniref:sensor histidine kinase n=1 Tax=Pedobacter deserti TaxID=2817382 RepID=UPI00210E5B4E|nr:GAF domain-containing protein [Pedobacter sp. SYSU D00382]
MPLSELERLKSLRRFLNLEITREAELQRIVDLAARICHCEIGLITFLDEDIQHFKVKSGTSLTHTERRDAFCNHTILEEEIMVVPDAEKDSRFAENNLVTGHPNIRFYAGARLRAADGALLGSLCVIDMKPNDLNEEQRLMLGVLRDQAMMLLDFELSVDILKEQFDRAKRSESKIRAFFESSAACHLFLGSDYEVLHYNKAVVDFVKRNSGMRINIGDKITDYVHPQHLDVFKANFERAMKGESVSNDVKLSYAQEDIWWQIDYDPVYATDGRIIGVSYNATDISARKAHELKITQQNEALTEIARIQSHEIRRPVASILGLVNVIKTLPQHELSEYIDMLGTAAGELDGKIHTMMGKINDNGSLGNSF